MDERKRYLLRSLRGQFRKLERQARYDAANQPDPPQFVRKEGFVNVYTASRANMADMADTLLKIRKERVLDKINNSLRVN